MVKNKNSLFGNKYLNIIDSELKIGEFTVKDLIDIHNSPQFLFYLPKIRDNINLISTCFSEVFEKFRGFYSTKSNYLNGIIKIVLGHGSCTAGARAWCATRDPRNSSTADNLA